MTERERRGLETVVEIEFRRSLDREKHRQTQTTLEKEAQLTSEGDRHRISL